MVAKEDQLLKKLQQAFGEIFELESKIGTSHKDTVAALNSIENYCEQLHCVQKVKFQDTPLAKYSDLQNDLNYKLCKEAEKKLKILQDFSNQLQDFSNCIDKRYRSVMTLYPSLGSDLTVSDLCQGHPTRPSAAHMMEWLDDLNQDVFVLHLSRHQLVSNLDYRSPESIQKLTKEWAYDANLNKKFKELKCYLKYFMEERY